MSTHPRSAESDSPGSAVQGDRTGVVRPREVPYSPAQGHLGNALPEQKHEILNERGSQASSTPSESDHQCGIRARHAIAQQIADAILADADPLIASRTGAAQWEAAYRAARIALQIGARHART